jgi:hypothetical protein
VRGRLAPERHGGRDVYYFWWLIGWGLPSQTTNEVAHVIVAGRVGGRFALGKGIHHRRIAARRREPSAFVPGSLPSFVLSVESFRRMCRFWFCNTADFSEEWLLEDSRIRTWAKTRTHVRQKMAPSRFQTDWA